MITVVFTMSRHRLVHWDSLLRELALNYGRGVGPERREPEIDVFLDPTDQQPKFIARLPDKTEWVQGEDDSAFDGLVERAVLASYEMRGASSIRQVAELDDEAPFERKQRDMQQLLDIE